MTRFPNGLSSYGIPVLPGTPPLFGPTSKPVFCYPFGGSDAQSGTSPARAVKTLYKAHSLMTAGQNDICYLIGNGAANGSARLSTANAASVDSTATTGTLTWSKAACHLIGVAAPGTNARARIAVPTGTYTEATFNALPFITVSASGCMFSNLSTWQGFSTGLDGEICLNVTGHYNVFNNVFVGGMADAESAAGVSSRNLKVAGDENTFVNCEIGIDTILRNTTANASLEFAANPTSGTGAARNKFVDCVFPIYTSYAGSLFILGTGAACVDRWQLFDNCKFINNLKSGSGTNMTVGGSFTSASPGGEIMFHNCARIGFTKWGDTNFLANSYVDNVGGAATDGLSLNPT